MKITMCSRGILILFLGILIPLFNAKASVEHAPYSVILKQINEVSIPGTPIDIQIKDGYAYIVCSSGDNGGVLVSVNIYDPYNIPPYTAFPGLADKPVAIVFNSSYAYIAQYNGGIQVANFKNRNAPVQSGYIDVIGKINKMAVSNGYLIFIRSDFGLNIYDISVPDFPVSRGVQLITGDATGLFVKNNYAFVTSSTANMSIIDISQIATLPIIGSYIAGINFYDVFVSDNYAYISQGTTGVQVVNVSKLSNPVQLTNIFSRRFAKQVVISGYYTWINDENSIQAFYNKDPKDQLWAGSFDNFGSSINKIDVEDAKYIYLCSYDNKLKVIQIYYNY